MAVLLDEVRKEFANFLHAQSDSRYSMDRALAHVVEIAYKAGYAEGLAASKSESDDD